MLSKRDQELLLGFASGEVTLQNLARARGGQPLHTTLQWLHSDDVTAFLTQTRQALDLQATLIASHTRIKALRVLDHLISDTEAPAETRRKAADASVRISQAIDARDQARTERIEQRRAREQATAQTTHREHGRSLERELREARQLLATADALEHMLHATESPPEPTTAAA